MEDTGKKNVGEQIDYTREQALELAKCANSFTYFTKYIKISTSNPTNEDSRCDLRDYQLEMAKMFVDNRFSIILSSRQSGKCVCGDSMITVRHKDVNNGEPLKISIEEFYTKY